MKKFVSLRLIRSFSILWCPRLVNDSVVFKVYYFLFWLFLPLSVPLEKDMFFQLKNLECTAPKYFVPCLIETTPLVLEKEISKRFQCVITMMLLSHFRKDALYFKFPLHKDAYCQVWLKLAMLNADKKLFPNITAFLLVVYL